MLDKTLIDHILDMVILYEVKAIRPCWTDYAKQSSWNNHWYKL